MLRAAAATERFRPFGGRYRSRRRSLRAVVDLQEAERRTSGFGEVHRYLALAYWQLGQKAKADEQLTLLAEMDPSGRGTAKLRRKFHGANN